MVLQDVIPSGFSQFQPFAFIGEEVSDLFPQFVLGPIQHPTNVLPIFHEFVKVLVVVGEHERATCDDIEILGVQIVRNLLIQANFRLPYFAHIIRAERGDHFESEFVAQTLSFGCHSADECEIACELTVTFPSIMGDRHASRGLQGLDPAGGNRHARLQ